MIKTDKYEIYNNDCLEQMQSIESNSIDTIICDLPFGTTCQKWDNLIPLDLLWEYYNRIIKDRGIIILFGSEPFTSKLILSNLKMFRYNLIYQKTQSTGFLNCKKQPLNDHETISIFYKKHGTYNPQFTIETDKRKFHNVKKERANSGTELYPTFKCNVQLRIDDGKRYPKRIIKFCNTNKTNSKKLHVNEKPQELLEYLIKQYTNENDIILDNTMGGGSCGEASINLNRYFIGIEKDEIYYHRCVGRLEKKYLEKYNLSR